MTGPPPTAPGPPSFMPVRVGGGRVKAIVLVDAAPGYEDQVEAALDDLDPVVSRTREKQDNFDIAALVEGENENAVQDAMNAIRHESGVQGLKIERDPGASLKKRLRPS